MFRLIGFVIGSAASVGALLFIFGVPQFNMHGSDADNARFDAAVEKLKAKKPEVDDLTEAVIEDVVGVANEVRDQINDMLAEQAGTPAATEAVEEITPPPAADELQWHPFWNPFRSEIAAKGFVSRLESVTGLDYRIVKVKAGVYEVAFGYSNEDERLTKLSQISAATGLDLSET